MADAGLSSLSLLRIVRDVFGRRIEEVRAMKDTDESAAVRLWAEGEFLELRQAEKQLRGMIYLSELDEE